MREDLDVPGVRRRPVHRLGLDVSERPESSARDVLKIGQTGSMLGPGPKKVLPAAFASLGLELRH
jgi:hypothetical protein